MRRAGALALLALAGCSSCATSPPAPPALTLGGRTVSLEILITAEAQARALSNRRQLAEYAGALLSGPTDRVWELSMARTDIPLEAVFVRASGEVSEVVPMEVEPRGMPEDEMQVYRPAEAVRHVVLLSSGWCARHGVGPGHTVVFSESTLAQLPSSLVAPLTVGGRSITVELALDPGTRERGLMWREALPKDHGMLFVETRDRPMSYWMKNCKIPLSIAFVRADGTIANVLEMSLPPTGVPDSGLPRFESEGAVRYALEMEAGWFERHGIGPGARLELSSELVQLARRVR